MNTQTQLRKLGLFDARVPRYTSYPPANHFNTGIGPDDAKDWIGAIPPGSEISLYVHIPFCRRLCWFCACRTQGTATAAPVAGYLDVVAQELRLIHEVLPKGVSLSRLHWGGGTPTLLTPSMIGELAGWIADLAPLAPGAEFSVEIDPNEIDAARVDALFAAGMNRASIGVQDFDPTIQAVIGRPQSFEITRDCVSLLREGGISSLNIDLLYGLPHQTPERISDSVQKVLSLAPDRLALYGYAHVPWMARRQSMIPEESLPRPEARLGLFETARNILVWDGYSEIGIDHFARPEDSLAKAARDGRLRRNFQGYTDDSADVLIATGASAISQFPQGYAQNDAATSGYHKRIVAGSLATTRGHRFSGDDLLRGAMIDALMCGFAADFAEIARRTGKTAEEAAALAEGVDVIFPGMVTLSGERLEIREEGKPLTRIIARWFDAYATGETAHSSAI